MATNQQQNNSGLSALQNEVTLFNLSCVTQGQFEDVLLFHRFAYYVKASPVWSDNLYDLAEKLLVELFPWSVVPRMVGSANPSDYPGYIREGRRPNLEEVAKRDSTVAAVKELFS